MASLRSEAEYAVDMSKKRWAGFAVPKRGSFGPMAALVPVRLMWSAIAMSEPGLYAGSMPPAALVTMRVLHPSRPSTRVGKVTWDIS